MAAAIFAVGALPLFLFTPDAPATGVPVLRAFGDGARRLWEMLRTVGRYRDAATYLLSRMFYVDGMNALLIYTGVYAAGVMKWHALALLAFGILLSILAVLGGFVGRWLDHGFGPKTAVRIEIGASVIGLALLLGMAPDRIAWFWRYDPAAHAPLWGGPVFRTLPDLIYLLIGFFNAVFVTAQYASSRTLLTRLTPPAQTGAFFGVYALSGTATSWLGPLLVNQGTHLFRSQQGGLRGHRPPAGDRLRRADVRARRRPADGRLAMSRAFLLGLALMILATPAVAGAATSIAVIGAWARPAARGGVTAGFFTLVNRGGLADRLTGASSPDAGRVGLHESRAMGSMSLMRPLAAAAIAGHATLDFAPGGKHLMIEGLRHALRPGDTLPVTLDFDRAGAIHARLQVRATPP